MTPETQSIILLMIENHLIVVVVLPRLKFCANKDDARFILQTYVNILKDMAIWDRAAV